MNIMEKKTEKIEIEAETNSRRSRRGGKKSY